VNTVRTGPGRAPIAARFDADAAALQLQIVEGNEISARARHVRPGNQPGAAGPRRHGARSRTAAPKVTVGRRAVVDLPCRMHDPDLWFADAPDDLERAKILCQGCPVQLACLAGAIDRREATGVWGGQIIDNGQIVTHKRPRGRPRKHSTTPQRYPALPGETCGPHPDRHDWLSAACL